MSRLSLVLLPLLSLTACMEAAPPASKPGNDGVAQKLAMGVSRAEAEVALGTEAGFERNPKNYDESCVSYAYGDFGGGPRYVHATYRGGKLVARTDGHSGLCTYGSLISG